jgi:hypothetical protein
MRGQLIAGSPACHPEHSMKGGEVQDITATLSNISHDLSHATDRGVYIFQPPNRSQLFFKQHLIIGEAVLNNIYG